jgi:hypothetical protein
VQKEPRFGLAAFAIIIGMMRTVVYGIYGGTMLVQFLFHLAVDKGERLLREIAPGYA